MARTRQQNVTAAQWSANGAALGAPDLTEPGSYPFGDNVFSLAVQKQRLAQRLRVSGKAPLPQAMAQDDFVRSHGALVGCEDTPEEGRDSQ